jgi:hypothetical protein
MQRRGSWNSLTVSGSYSSTRMLKGGLRYRPSVDQSLVKVSPQEDELDELKRKPFTEWKF